MAISTDTRNLISVLTQTVAMSLRESPHHPREPRHFGKGARFRHRSPAASRSRAQTTTAFIDLQARRNSTPDFDAWQLRRDAPRRSEEGSDVCYKSLESRRIGICG
jgi:hypothetical protein